jgi:hypothetical protein
MATPVFKFRENSSEQDYFFIYDTYHELPQTIPMCLSTFVLYHLKTQRRLDGFLASFEGIMKSGASLGDATYDEFFNEEEKAFYLNQLSECYAKGELKLFYTESILMREFFENGDFTMQSLKDFMDKNLVETMKEFRSVDFYKSLSNTIPFIPYEQESSGNSNPSDCNDDDLPF